jgi:hypothetical protein
MKSHSLAAQAFDENLRQQGAHIALWRDVEAAYDAGMKHAIEARQSARAQLNVNRNRKPFTIEPSRWNP